MEKYDEIVLAWKNQKLRSVAELAAALNGYIIQFAYHSGKIENMERDVRARDDYRRSLRGQIRVPNKLTIERIIQEGIRNDDEILLRPLYRGRTGESWQHV